jgi:hypothetical protein
VAETPDDVTLLNLSVPLTFHVYLLPFQGFCHVQFALYMIFVSRCYRRLAGCPCFPLGVTHS